MPNALAARISLEYLHAFRLVACPEYLVYRPKVAVSVKNLGSFWIVCCNAGAQLPTVLKVEKQLVEIEQCAVGSLLVAVWFYVNGGDAALFMNLVVQAKSPLC